jgi:hypothetical protein
MIDYMINVSDRLPLVSILCINLFCVHLWQICGYHCNVGHYDWTYRDRVVGCLVRQGTARASFDCIVCIVSKSVCIV